MTFRAEPTWEGAGAAPAEAYAAGPTSPAPAVIGVDGAEQSSMKDLESEVYTARDVHGDDRVKLRRKLARARSSMTEASYRRALELARDSVLLTVEECLEGAQAMEWEPLPRPEFSLASIEAAVAEQERAEQVRASYERTQREAAEQAPEEQAPEEQGSEEQGSEGRASEEQASEEQAPAEQASGESEIPEQERAEQVPEDQEGTEREVAKQEERADTAPPEQEPAEGEAAAETAAEQEPTEPAERESSGTSRRAG